MLSINTNLSSLNVQKNLNKSTNALNTAIERLTTGYKINHAADNAANYSIARNMDSQISAYEVAADNIAMGSDMISTAMDSISLLQNRAERLMDLWNQAQNGTYGEQSIKAIQSEVNAIVDEIDRIYENTEYNGIKLLGYELPDWAQELKNNTSPKAEYNGFIANPVTYTDDEVAAMTSLSSVSPTSTISSGTYKISSKDELKQLATMVNNGKVTGGEFVLGGDIDLGGEEWTAIGTDSSHSFKGTFDGNGHKITGLKINKEGSDYQGLFGYTKGSSTIKNVWVNGDIKGRSYTGGLVGNSSGGTITNVCFTGNVAGNSLVGGLVGSTSNYIVSSYIEGNVFGIDRVGGLAGSTSGVIANSFAKSSLLGKNLIGGLVGQSSGSIENSYSTGIVSGASQVGGLAGKVSGTVTNSFSLDDLDSETTLQVGINGDSSSRITTNTHLNDTIRINDISQTSAYDTIQGFLDKLSARSTELGAVYNRLQSAGESTLTAMENLTSSRSTIKDADIAKESSAYIRSQILQQASATLLATANQTPALTLQLLQGLK